MPSSLAMRVLHVNNYHYPRGGSDRYFLSVARALSERGHDIQTLSTSDPRDVCHDLKSNVELQTQELEAKQSPRKIAKFFYNTAARSGIRDLIEEFKPDVAHLHIYYGQITPSILQPLKAARIPILQTLHEYKIVCPAQSLMRNEKPCKACKNRKYWNAVVGRCNRGSLARSAVSTIESVTSELIGARRLVDQFLAVSEFQKIQLIEMGLDENKISVLHNFSEISDTPSIEPGEYFLFVGRLTKGKGVDTLLKAFRAYLDICGEARLPLHIVGHGPDKDALMALCKALDLTSHVQWLGYMDGQPLESQYRSCKALINPSELNETFGLTNLEAMGHGRAVICSNIGAFPEVIRDGIDGYMAPAGDPYALADHMVTLSDKNHPNLGVNGYQQAKNLFSKDEHLKKLELIYRKLTVRI